MHWHTCATALAQAKYKLAQTSVSRNVLGFWVQGGVGAARCKVVLPRPGGRQPTLVTCVSGQWAGAVNAMEAGEWEVRVWQEGSKCVRGKRT